MSLNQTFFAVLNTEPVYHEVVIMTRICYKTWRTQKQLLRYERVRVRWPEVTQHADTVNQLKGCLGYITWHNKG